MTFEIYSCMDYYYYLFMPKYKLEGIRETLDPISYHTYI